MRPLHGLLVLVKQEVFILEQSSQALLSKLSSANFLFGTELLGNHRANTLLIAKSSRRILKTLASDIPTSLAITDTFNRQSADIKC